jgi:erythronate-4-phosphate dehydrogenase
MTPFLYDPPREDGGEDDDFVSLDAVCDCDVLTLHVPLVDAGPYPTRRLVDELFLARLRECRLFINTSRGNVVDEWALKAWLDAHSKVSCVLDVWQNEPAIDPDTLERSTIGTPHIAGYSIDAKLRGTQMIHDSCAAWLGQEPYWCYENYSPLPPPPIVPGAPLDISDVLRCAYDIGADDAALRTAIRGDGDSFHALRKHYPPRREWHAFHVDTNNLPPSGRTTLRDMGFSVDR